MAHLRKAAYPSELERIKALSLDGFAAAEIVRMTGANIHTVRVLMRQTGTLEPGRDVSPVDSCERG